MRLGGSQKARKTYLTQIIDVDSHGRKCGLSPPPHGMRMREWNLQKAERRHPANSNVVSDSPTTFLIAIVHCFFKYI